MARTVLTRQALVTAIPGSPVKAQWRITDPAAVNDDPVRRKAAFRRAFSELENRVKLFALVWDNSSRLRFLRPDSRAARAATATVRGPDLPGEAHEGIDKRQETAAASRT